MTDVAPTPEELAQAKAVIQAAMTAETNRRKREAEEALSPLIALGLGTDNPINISFSDLITAMDQAMPKIRDYDRGLYTSLEHSIIQLNNVIDRVRTIGSQFA